MPGSAHGEARTHTRIPCIVSSPPAACWHSACRCPSRARRRRLRTIRPSRSSTATLRGTSSSSNASSKPRVAGDVIFLGDSITHGWEGQKRPGRSTSAAFKPVNLGIGGDQTGHVLYASPRLWASWRDRSAQAEGGGHHDRHEQRAFRSADRRRRQGHRRRAETSEAGHQDLGAGRLPARQCERRRTDGRTDHGEHRPDQRGAQEAGAGRQAPQRPLFRNCR